MPEPIETSEFDRHLDDGPSTGPTNISWPDHGPVGPEKINRW